MKRLFAGLVALAVFAAPAAAADFLSSAFGNAGDSCFARRYDAAHLAKNPAQNVESIFIVSTGHSDPDTKAILHIGLKLRGSDALYDGFAYCNASGEGAACNMEGDGGSMTITPRKNGIRIAVGNFFMLEGAAGFTPDLATEGDDRVLLLYPAPAGACK
ncbi:MAG: hypothetical protein C0606_09015 [Hyphomicrobiales bacterium]|nr:MAG: hypothetical protein C0606_09015 [Hyphomicrobiales bacterium]